MMSDTDSGQVDDKPPAGTQADSNSRKTDFWLSVWLGTALAGGVFGLLFGLTALASEGVAAAIFGAGAGFVSGFILAGIVATPVMIAAIAASWAFGISRLHAIQAIITGGATGILSTLPIAESKEFSFRFTALLAGMLGALGAWSAAAVSARRAGQRLDDAGEHVAQVPLAKRFCRVAGLLLVLVAVCLGANCLIKQARETSRRDNCRNKLKQIALALQNYEMGHKALPPAFLTDKTGQPVLSWRAVAAKYCLHYTDLSALFDLNKPWNKLRDLNRINYVANSFHCPSSDKLRDDPRTDYVAVVGPDTLWPGKQPADLQKRSKGILVVEWPKSDIHWAEPRDITVEEFLDWFRHPPQRSFWDWLFVRRHDHNSFHPDGLLYVDGEGNVGLLRNDTDPEVVRRMLRGE